MRNRISRHLLMALLGLYVLSTIPFAMPGQAQTLNDATARFRQQRNTIGGRRDLPTSADAGLVPAAPVDVDQAARLEQLRARWAREQTRDLPSPRTTDPSRIYLPSVMENAGIATQEENIAPVEVPAYRTTTSKVYRLSNGLWRAEVAAQPIHYRQDGQWLPYAPALAPSAGADALLPGYRAVGTDLDLRFATPTNAQPLTPGAHLVELRQEQLRLGFTPQHADLTRVRSSGATITYVEAFPNADLRYTATGPGVKEELILRRPPAADAALRLFRVVSSINRTRRSWCAILPANPGGRSRRRSWSIGREPRATPWKCAWRHWPTDVTR